MQTIHTKRLRLSAEHRAFNCLKSVPLEGVLASMDDTELPIFVKKFNSRTRKTFYSDINYSGSSVLSLISKTALNGLTDDNAPFAANITPPQIFLESDIRALADKPTYNSLEVTGVQNAPVSVVHTTKLPGTHKGKNVATVSVMTVHQKLQTSDIIDPSQYSLEKMPILDNGNIRLKSGIIVPAPKPGVRSKCTVLVNADEAAILYYRLGKNEKMSFNEIANILGFSPTWIDKCIAKMLANNGLTHRDELKILAERLGYVIPKIFSPQWLCDNTRA